MRVYSEHEFIREFITEKTDEAIARHRVEHPSMKNLLILMDCFSLKKLTYEYSQDHGKAVDFMFADQYGFRYRGHLVIPLETTVETIIVQRFNVDDVMSDAVNAYEEMLRLERELVSWEPEPLDIEQIEKYLGIGQGD